MQPGRLETALNSGAFCITAEIVPPLSADPRTLLDRAAPLHGLVTAINVTDGAGAKTTVSSVAAAAILRQNGIEPVLQLTCRDRNRIALAADLLGAAALGVTNLLPLFGDDPKHGDQPDAKPVHDLDTLGLIRLARDMRDRGILPSGRHIENSPNFYIGAADVPRELRPGGPAPALAAKVEAGARFVQTQLCFDLELLRRYLDGLDRCKLLGSVKVLPGLGPIASLRSAQWMKQNLWGTAIPNPILQRLADARSQRDEGRRICVELIDAVRELPGIAGVHVMAPGGSTADIAALIRDSGLA